MYDTDNTDELTAEALQLIHDAEFTDLYDNCSMDFVAVPVPAWMLD